jgi:hypothetical protein
VFMKQALRFRLIKLMTGDPESPEIWVRSGTAIRKNGEIYTRGTVSWDINYAEIAKYLPAA